MFENIYPHDVMEIKFYLCDLTSPNPGLIMRTHLETQQRMSYSKLDRYSSKLSKVIYKKDLRDCHSQEKSKETERLNVL